MIEVDGTMGNGGGTTCSSALKLIQSQFENRFPPNTWNIYLFYFTDGENWDGDNEIFSYNVLYLYGL